MLKQAFEQLTDTQIMDMQVPIGMHRLELTQFANSCDCLWKPLSAHHFLRDVYQVLLSEIFSRYISIKETSGHDVYQELDKEAT